MKAIITRFLGPTATKGARVTASDEEGNRVTVPYREDLAPGGAHAVAAFALCQKMGWKANLVSGSIKNGYAFVMEVG